MYDAIGDQDVRGDDLGAVNEDRAIRDSDGKVHAAHRGKHCAVLEGRAVTDGAIDNCSYTCQKSMVHDIAQACLP